MTTSRTLSSRLNTEQREFYEENGYYFPIRVFSDDETAEFKSEFEAYTKANQLRLKEMLPRERRAIYSLTHMSLPWANRIVSHPRILDAVEAIIGPNILVWESMWFVKFPHDKTFISWHQDGAYWGLHPPNVTTAWVALSSSTPENGCMRVVPKTHRTALPQRDTYAADNALSRGQEIDVEVDEAQGVNLVLSPGEISLHHIGIVHGSKPNESNDPRIGFAVRYIAPEVVQDGSERQMVLLVRGKDDYGHYRVVDPSEAGAISTLTQQEAERLFLKNVVQKESTSIRTARVETDLL
jgi:non-haem Fe2+, alpha-ketoglutarate-dependent halogenase